MILPPITLKFGKTSGKSSWDTNLQLCQTDLRQSSCRVEVSSSTSAPQPSAEQLGLGTLLNMLPPELSDKLDLSFSWLEKFDFARIKSSA